MLVAGSCSPARMVQLRLLPPLSHLQPLAQRVVPACVAAVRKTGITAPVFFTANDGTLMSAEQAQQVGHQQGMPGTVKAVQCSASAQGSRWSEQKAGTQALGCWLLASQSATDIFLDPRNRAPLLLAAAASVNFSVGACQQLEGRCLVDWPPRRGCS